MKLGIEFGAIKKLKENIISEFGEKGDATKLVNDILRVTANRCLSKTVKRTPADTGNLRKNWKTGNIQHKGFYHTITIENPVEYATYIEYGHRVTKKQMFFLIANNIIDPSKPKRSKNGWYEGHFMVTKSMAEAKEELPEIADEMMVKKFSEILP